MARREKAGAISSEEKYPRRNINRWMSRHGFILAEIAARYGVPLDAIDTLARETLERVYGVYEVKDGATSWDEVGDYPHGREAREEVQRIVLADPYSGDKNEWDGWQEQRWRMSVW